MRHRLQNKYQGSPDNLDIVNEPTQPFPSYYLAQQSISPPIGGAMPTPSSVMPSPVISAPLGGYATYEIKPPMGSVSLPASYLPPIGSTPDDCCSFEPPIGSEPSTLVPSTPIQPPTGSYPAIGVPSYPIKPPIGGAPMPY